MTYDTAFQIAVANLRFGAGVTREAGLDLEELGARRVMLVIDPALKDLPTGGTVIESLRASRIDFAVYEGVSVEPTDRSFKAAAAFAVTTGLGEAACVWLSYRRRGETAPPDEVRRAFATGLAEGLRQAKSQARSGEAAHEAR